MVGHNYVSPENLRSPLIPTDVECAAFTDSGDWLATFERRDDGLTTVEARLKFWLYSTEKNRFCNQQSSLLAVFHHFDPSFDSIVPWNSFLLGCLALLLSVFCYYSSHCLVS